MSAQGSRDTAQEAEFGVLRDASFYRTHHQTDTRASYSHIPKYHVPANEKMTMTACGLPAAEFTAVPVEDLDLLDRCQRPACKKRWPPVRPVLDSEEESDA